MVITFSAVLFGLLALIKPLQKNRFYILNSALIIGLAYVVEHNYFRTTPFAPKTFLLLVVFQFITINFTTFLAYYVDKRAAKRGEYRIPESDLHTLEFLGGTLGALLGQKILHHKNKKKSYQFIFHFLIVVQIIAIIAILRYLHLI